MALGWSLFVVIAAGSCTAKPAGRTGPKPSTPSVQSLPLAGSLSSSAGPSAPDNPRLCSSLVGQPFHSAMSGGGVTCSLGAGTSSADIRVIARQCPDGAPFYEFYSTDSSPGADPSVYYGSQITQLNQASSRSITVQVMETQSCP